MEKEYKERYRKIKRGKRRKKAERRRKRERERERERGVRINSATSRLISR